MSSGGSGGGGGFNQVPSTSLDPQQPPSLQRGGGGEGGGAATLTPSGPEDEYVAYVGQDPQFGHSGGCSQHGRPGNNGPTAMFSGANSVAAAPNMPCPSPALETPTRATETVAPSVLPAQRDNEAPRKQDVDVVGGGGHGQTSVYPWMVPGRPVHNTPGPVVETHRQEARQEVAANRFERGVQIRGGGPTFPVETARASSDSGIDVRMAEPISQPIAVTRTSRCQYEHCPNIPRYGAKDAPPRFCRFHKRIGMYFARAGGRWMIATRNGDGIRRASPTVVPGGGTTTRSAFNYGCRPVMPGFSLATKQGACTVQSPAEPGDKGTSPDSGATRTLSLSRPSVSRPNPSFNLATKQGACAVQSPAGPGDNTTRPDSGATRTLSVTRPLVPRPNPSFSLATKQGACAVQSSAGPGDNTTRPDSGATRTLSLTRPSVARLSPSFSLAPKQGACAVQSPAGPGDNTTRPDSGATRTLLLTRPSVARLSPNSTRGRIRCEFPGCRVRLNIDVNDRKPARLCFKHRKKPVALKTKGPVCIHRGCNVQPHYGLPMGRQLYCANHKGDGMVCILKGGLVMAIENATRKKAENFANRILHQGGDGHTVEGIEGTNTGTDTELNRGGHFAVREQDNAEPAYTPQQADSPTESRSPPSRTVYGCDTSPLADMDLLKNARQLAQAEAEASGTGKRAKTPSRKALEASGVAGVVQDAPQHMTKEMRNATTKTTSSRMANQRPGLKENCVRDFFAGHGTNDVVGNGGFLGRFGGSGFSRVRDVSEEVSPCVGEILEEYLEQRRQHVQEHQQQKEQQQQELQEQEHDQQQQQKQPQHQRQQRQQPKRQCQQQQHHKSSVLQRSPQPQSSFGETGVFSTSNPRPGHAPNRGTDSSIADKTPNTKKQRGEVPGKNGKRKANKNATCGLKNNSGGLNINTGGLKISNGMLKNTCDEFQNEQNNEDAGATKIVTPCAFDECKAAATYGVNNIVRYCKNHRLFGMYKIP